MHPQSIGCQSRSGRRRKDLLLPLTKKVALELPSVRAMSSSYWKMPSAGRQWGQSSRECLLTIKRECHLSAVDTIPNDLHGRSFLQVRAFGRRRGGGDERERGQGDGEVAEEHARSLCSEAKGD